MPIADASRSGHSLRPGWVARQLGRWFDRHARDLPWRRSADPYRIWVSEVMLQQTQVATVIPYFERFVQRFPDLATLAAAPEHDVLRLWEGLGYYRRARDLHRAARLLVAEHESIPADPAALHELPGWGRYTVNAVLSQAFDMRLPILEANSTRVLCRLLGVRADPKQAQVQKTLWQAASELLPQRRVGRFNQGLMELGALICKPDRPDCGRCPLRAGCYASLHGLQSAIPVSARRASSVQVDEVAVVPSYRGRLLLVQRAAEGRWGNLWEFPHTPLEFMESHATAAGRLLAELGLAGTVSSEIMTIRHSVTRFQITMVCLAVPCQHGQASCGRYQQTLWLRPGELGNYPLSAPQRRLAARMAEATPTR
jgi:A/G-specific adenine glycosylase